MATVHFRSADSYDGHAEYFALKARRPAEAAALCKTIALIAENPAVAVRDHSVALDPVLGYRATPYLRALGMLTCLAWRQLPELEAVEVIDFDQPYRDLPMPVVWPRD